MDAGGVFVVGAAVAFTLQLAVQLLRTLVALPRPRVRGMTPVAAPEVTSPAVPAPAVAGDPAGTGTGDDRPAHTGALAAWHYPPFTIYFFGLLAGVTGYFMYFTAQGWLALQLTNSAAGVSFLFMVSSLPMVLLTLFGGALADRLDRRSVVMVTRLLISAVTAVMGLLALTDQMTVGTFIALSLALGTIWALDLPTRQALVADLVPAPALGNAYAWQSVLQFIGSMVGPVVAGTIVLRAGPGAALLVGAAGHVMVSFALLLVRPTQRRSISREGILRRVGGGMVYLKRNQSVLLLILLATVPPLTAYAIVPLMPIVARDVLRGDAATYGWLTAAIGVGSIFGAVFVAASARWQRKGLMAVAGTVLGALFLVAVAYTDDVRVALVLLALHGAAAGVASTLEAALVQVLTPPEFQGRVASIFMMTWNVQPLGMLLFGAVGEARGVPVAIWLAGLTMAGVALLLAATRPALLRIRT